MSDIASALRSAEAEVKQLRADRDRLAAELHEARNERRREHELRCRLAAELEAARADAERYRWLRDNQNRDALKRLNNETALKAMDIAAEKYGDEWDAAIDAARATLSAGDSNAE